MESIKNIMRLLREGLSGLYPDREAEQIARLLFREYLGWNAATIILNGDQTISREEVGKFLQALKALQRGEPVQYIIGKTDFHGIVLHVADGVLIPRPETEEMVTTVIDLLRHSQLVNPAILDIGTGSGCIAIALKEAIPGAIVDATDNSPEAIAIAGKNAELNHAGVRFFLNDILDVETHGDLGLYDAIVSNPPYIPEKERSKLHTNVLDFEPHSALFVPDDDPLLFYRAIARVALGHLKSSGILFVEIHENYGKQVQNLFHESGFRDVRIHKDINEKDRFVSLIAPAES